VPGAIALELPQVGKKYKQIPLSHHF